MAYYPGKQMINERLKTQSVTDIAEALEVHPAHVYNVDERGVSRPLYEAMVDAGWMESRKRWRLHYEAGRGEQGRERYERVKSFLKAWKYENLTELVDELMEVTADDIKGKE